MLIGKSLLLLMIINLLETLYHTVEAKTQTEQLEGSNIFLGCLFAFELNVYDENILMCFSEKSN